MVKVGIKQQECSDWELGEMENSFTIEFVAQKGEANKHC